MLVRAIKKGFCGKALRYEGDVFEFDGPLGTWMEEVEPEAPKKKGKESKESEPNKRKNEQEIE